MRPMAAASAALIAWTLLPGCAARTPAGRQSLATPSRCDRPPPSRLAYGWPVRPFDRQHPIRGNFGDPRTISESPRLGSDTSLSAGSYSFHNGIDIAAPAGTPVYPVVSGIVSIRSSDELVVATADGRLFQYWHLLTQVHTGEHVVARQTILGRIRPEADHVHLTEIDGFRVHNPVDPGHLEPYRDHTPPEVVTLDFDDSTGATLAPQALHGRVLIGAVARDTPPLPVPGAWLGYPVTPALVAWKLDANGDKTVVPWTTVADFRQTEPPTSDFWRVYADGTYQNFPVFADRYFWRQSGRYVFDLTPQALDTTRLKNGAYTVTVAVADVCGNQSTLRTRVRVENPVASAASGHG